MKNETQIKQQNWFALEITVNSDASEAIEFALNELDALGTEINNLGKIQTETVTIVGYFNEIVSNDLLEIHLSDALRIYNLKNSVVKKMEWQEVKNQDWLAEWKKHWKPTETDKFIIAPRWKRVSRKTGKIVIRIEPSMAFGTGTHETTRLCLQAIEENFDGEMSFLDIGTGTGILAIAAAKLCLPDYKYIIVGLDTDKDSIKIAEENAKLNKVKEVYFYKTTLNQRIPKPDFVCANLTADVIVPMLPLLLEKCNQILVLSGILKEQENWVLGELKKLGVKNSEIKTDGEWISILVRK